VINRSLITKPAAVFMALSIGLAVGGFANADEGNKSADEIVREAVQPTRNWALPPTGPKAVADKTVVYVAETLLNGGILGVGEGVREAIDAIGWKLIVFDARGKPEGRSDALRKVLDMRPDGLILGGFNASDNVKELEEIARNGTSIVGWHAGPTFGPLAGTPVSFNVTTDPLLVARTAASYVVVDSGGKAGVVIFTDRRYSIAVTKSDAMADVIRECDGCELLSIENVSLDKTAEIIPELTSALLAKYGARWTHSLGINDLYFDAAAPALAIAGVSADDGIANISAGDGSVSAYDRIRAKSYQVGTVPEPLILHGWQLIDELNRVFSGEPVSGYVIPTRLVLPANANQDGGQKGVFDPENGY
jgi:ribose transport system substrate-binding protein